MKIDRVIVSTTSHKNYINFWPIVSKSWKNLGITPTLIYTSNKKIKFDPKEDVININVSEIDPIFTAQNSRLLVPSLFPNDVCLTSDIDIMPLSKNYFFDKIKEINKDNFVIYRPDACPPNMLALCFNAALGKTWNELFEVSTVNEIKKLLIEWYPKEYIAFKNNWYFDQIKLRERLETFRKIYSDRVKTLSDQETNFNRLNRDNLKIDMKKYLTSEEYFSDFHMPRPYNLYKRKINKIYSKAFDEYI
tara:strand:- start:2424 stop:3167 length:744 start_codon:yes stop_codon:yes gene_type:complete